jgi:hypothetical protein
MHAVSGRWRSLRRGRKRQTSRFERQLPALLAEAACQESTDVACYAIYDWQGRTQPSRDVARLCFSVLSIDKNCLGKPQYDEPGGELKLSRLSMARSLLRLWARHFTRVDRRSGFCHTLATLFRYPGHTTSFRTGSYTIYCTLGHVCK